MKILDIAYDARIEQYDGPYIHTMSLAEKMAEKIKIDLIIRSDGDKKRQKNTKGSLTVTSFPFKDIQKLSFVHKVFFIVLNNIKLISYVLKNWQEYELIYERHNLNMIAGIIISKLKRTPLIYEVNGIPDEDAVIIYRINNRIIKRFFKFLCTSQLRNADKIIVQTEELRQIIINRFGCSDVFVVPNGAELRKKNKFVKKPGAPLKLIFSGSLDEQHDITPLLTDLSTLKKNYTLDIVGSGPLLEEFKHRFNKEKRFNFIGKVSHKKSLDLISGSDVCLVYYNKDYKEFKKYGFYYCPIKLLEYASFGKPIIVFNVQNSVINYFERNKSCTVLKQDEGYLEELISLINNRNKLNMLGENALKLVRKYTWENGARRTLEIITSDDRLSY